MNLDQLTEFFKWMTIINVILFLVNTVLIILLRKVLCRLYGKLFGLSEDHASIIMFAWLGLFRIIILAFNIVPFVAFSIISR